jgi:hypothetical protein
MNQGILIALITGINGLLLFIFQTVFTAKVTKQFNDESESLKQDFSTKLAKFQADLEKQNITHQVVQAEKHKFKYEKITSLFKLVAERNRKNSVPIPHNTLINVELLIRCQKESYELNQRLEGILTEALPIIDDKMANEISVYITISFSYFESCIAHYMTKLNLKSLDKSPLSQAEKKQKEELADRLSDNIRERNELVDVEKESFERIKGLFKVYFT